MHKEPTSKYVSKDPTYRCIDLLADFPNYTFARHDSAMLPHPHPGLWLLYGGAIEIAEGGHAGPGLLNLQ